MPGAVVVVGSSIVDMTTVAPRLPVAGETLPGSGFVTGFGGKGANQAAIVAKLGGAVAMVSKLGDDAFGRDYRANFRTLGVDDRWVTVAAGQPTGVASIWVDEHSGANQIIVVLGANDTLSVDDVAAATDTIAGARVVVAQWECPLPAVAAAFEIARRHGVTTIFNPAPMRGALTDELLSRCDIVCPNEVEAATLTGIAVTDLDRASQAGRALVARGAGAALITLGERGSVLVDADGVHHQPAEPARAVDTTGAGDAFVGTFAHFVAQGVDRIDAMRRAGVVAARSVEQMGAQASFPTRAELPAELFAP